MNLITRLGGAARMAWRAWQYPAIMARAGSALGADDTVDALLWADQLWTVPSATGIGINQQTSLNAAAVMACVTMIAEDVAKLPVALYRRKPNGGRARVKPTEHWLAALLRRPNDWQNWLEFCEVINTGLIMRGNGYAVILRNGRGKPVTLVPINPDRVALWQAQDGELFYKVTPFGLHELAVLKDEPFFIPYEDMFHLRGFSLNGLLGASRIMLAKEAIGLSLAQERQAAQWMGAGAKPSGVLTTDQKLTIESAKRIREQWKDLHAGLANSGRTAILEAGLKWTPLSMTSQDLEFIGSRGFQVKEVARVFRVPLYMLGDPSQSTNNNITQLAQEYVNNTISAYIARWCAKFDERFDLQEDDLFVDFDLTAILRGDPTTRYANYRTGIMTGWMKPNEARIDDGKDPEPGRADQLQFPLNMGTGGSDSTGEAADGGGRPPDGTVSPGNTN